MGIPDKLYEIVQIENLSAEYGSKMLKAFMKDDESLNTTIFDEKHEIFDNSLTSDQIYKIYMLIKCN